MKKRPVDSLKEKKHPLPEGVLQHVAAGRVLQAMQETGRAFSISGTIVEGNKIGRTLGYPTANLEPDECTPVLPGQGVYTAMVLLQGQWYDSMVNVGIRPTLNLNQVTIEAHLFSISGDLYGLKMSIHLLEKMRDEMRFSSLSALKSQLDTDRDTAIQAINAMRQQLAVTAEEVLYTKSS